MPKRNTTAQNPTWWNRWSVWIALFCLMVLVGVLFIKDEPTAAQRWIIRFFMALSSALILSNLMGRVNVQWKVLGMDFRAGGPIALFIIVLFVDPLDLKTVVADRVPGALPVDSTIVRTQERLAGEGLYKGPVTGKADSRTRDAIRKYQVSKDLEVTGYVGEETKAALLGVK
jgi:hypothetical protein